MTDVMKTDFRLDFLAGGDVDIDFTGGEARTVEDLDNLAQALTLRLLTHKGEMAHLGHPSYGSRVHELIGEPLDRANLELLRRFVRQALLEEPRVEEVTRVVARARQDVPGAVDIEVAVTAVTGDAVQLAVTVDLG